MTDQDNSYRPRSPDFSSFPSSFEPSSTPYSPAAPYPLTSPVAHRASYDASPFFNPQPPQLHPHPQPQYQPPTHAHPQTPFQRPVQQYIPQNLEYPFPDMAPRTRSQAQGPVVPVEQPAVEWQHQQQQQQHVPPELPATAPARKMRKTETTRPAPAPAPAPAPVPVPVPVPAQSSASGGIEVKTKFPVARIKRIMQADEDVGKVAQVTPIAVSKALELFMISLVTKAATEAQNKSSKRITANHLKEAIGKDEVLDFLDDIISKVPDQPAAKKDDDGSDGGEGRKRKGGGRRKKEEPDDF